MGARAVGRPVSPNVDTNEVATTPRRGSLALHLPPASNHKRTHDHRREPNVYKLKPKAIFAHKRVYDNPRAVARMERMLDAMDIPRSSVPTVTMDDVDTIVQVAGATDDIANEEIVKGGHGRVRQGILKLAHDPVMVFNTFVWDPADRVPPTKEFVNPHAKRLVRLFSGVGRDFAFSKRELLRKGQDYVCQGGWGIHSIGGCVHKCDYCGQGFIVNILLDLEEFCDALTEMFHERPEQKLYRYDLFSDILAFEPEYGCSEVVGECFAKNDKYLLLYTRSDNVQHLVDLPHKDHVLANWTLAMDTQCREIERDAPTLENRIEAMRICQQAGYAVRAGFSPIVPVANWREETTQMLELLFSRVQPEVLRGWVLAMMDAAEFERMFDVSKMDQKFMKRMREEAQALNGSHGAPFPLDVRAEIYAYYLDEARRISPETPFALCTEHPKLWEMLEDKLAMKPDNMFCCCGGLSTPGGWVQVNG